jgi:hypothetical protein
MNEQRKSLVIAGGVLLATLAASLGCGKQETAAPGARETPAQAGPKEPQRAAPSGAKEPERPAPAAQPVVLAEGTAISVRTTSALSSESHKAGDTFVAHLEAPLVAGERVIAAKGARVEGVVAHSSEGGRVKGRAAIAVRLTRLEAADGEMVEISTNPVGREAKSTKKQDAVKVGIGSGVGAAIGAIAGGGKGAAIGAASGAGAGTGYVLATRGAAAVIPSESVLRFELAGPVTVRASIPPPRR